MRNIITEILQKLVFFIILIAVSVSLKAQWANQVIDTITSNTVADETGYQAMAVDGQNKVHLIYLSQGTAGTEIKYTNKPCGQNWSTPITISASGHSPYEPTLAVNDGGKVGVAYQNGSGASGEVVVAQDSSGIWIQTQLTSNAIEDMDPSIAVDDSGYLHVAYITKDQVNDWKIAYSTNIGNNWNSQLLSTTFLGTYGSGAAPSMDVDPAQRAHIVYRGGNYQSYKINHVYNSTAGGTIWTNSTLNTGNAEDFTGIIKITDDTTAHFAISGNSGWGFPYHVYYIKKPVNGTYSNAIKANNLANGSVTSLAIDPNGYAHITYDHISGNFIMGNIYYSTNSNSIWMDTALAVTGQSFLASMAIDNNGTKYAAYYDGISSTGQEVYVIRNGNCAESAPPVANFTVSDNSICTGESVIFTNSSSNTQSYSWSFPGGTPSSSAIEHPVVLYNTAGVYDVTLIVTNSLGTDTLHQSAHITVAQSPVANAGADQAICSGDQVQLNATGGVSYSWTPTTFLSNATIANPLASPAITTSYIVSVTAANSCMDADTIVITVEPRFSVSTSADTAICEGESVQLTSSGATNYNWSPAATLSVSNISNPIATPTTTTTYQVVGDKAGACPADTAEVTVTVNPLPAKPSITQNGNLLNSSAASGNQWYMNGNILSGETNPSLAIIQGGNYHVVVTDGNGCENSSDVIYAAPVGINELHNVGFKIYTSGSDLVVEKAFKEEAQLNVFNLLGQEVLSTTVTQKIQRYQISAPAGVYLINFRMDNKDHTLKIYVN